MQQSGSTTRVQPAVRIEPGTCCENVFIPNAFSPNGDGLNDAFKMTTTAAVELNYFRVYDRWGNRVWAASDYRPAWDGKTKWHDNDNPAFY